MSEDATTTDPRHRVAAFVASAREDLTHLAEVSVWSMSAQETSSSLLGVTRLKAQVAELELRLLTRAEDEEIGLDTGATSTTNWWAHLTRMTRDEAYRPTRLAGRLGERHEPVRRALATGEVLADQAAVIVDAIEALPADLTDAGVVTEAEAVSLAYAADHDAKALRVLGRRILDVVAPEAGDAHEARLLEQQEDDARAAASFSMVEDGHGQCHGRFNIPTLHGHMLRKHLLALAAPNIGQLRVSQSPRASCRRGTGWVRRSASTSRPAPTRPSHTPAASPRRSW